MNPILAEIKKKAEAGDAAAQYFLGSCYDSGVGVLSDHAEAWKWYRKAAEQGDAKAQMALGDKYCDGVEYRDGFSVPKDRAEAVKWYRKAAEQGDVEAQCSLGGLYLNTYNSSYYAEAAKWYRVAAERGYAKAQYYLGYIYSEGLGVPKDLVQAHVWLNIAGANGHKTAKENLADVEKEMTSDQKAEAMKLARELFDKLPKGK